MFRHGHCAPGGASITYRVLVAVMLVALPVAAHHGDTLLPYVDETGRFEAGLVAVGVAPVNLARASFTPHVCHPDLQILLDFAPRNASASTEHAYAAVPFEYRVEVFDTSTAARLASFPFTAPGKRAVELDPSAVDGRVFRADLYMLRGVASEWELRVRGWPGDHPPCSLAVTEVEANPAGTDFGNEWVEIHNTGFSVVDVGGFVLRALHGSPEAAILVDGTRLAAGERLVVALDGQFLDNEDEVVTLEDATGRELVRTPPLTDAANDARTHQHVGGEWSFVEATPGT